MRFPWILTLALVTGAMPAGAQQKNNKLVIKSSREDKAKSSATVKAPTARNSSSAELQKIEQQTAKTATGSKGSGRARVASVKTQRERGNRPINFAAGTGGHGTGGGSANSSKSRVRTKGKR